MSGYVFVSYGRRDEDYVVRLVEYLASAGLVVWTDHGIDFGSRWAEVIRNQIEECTAVVVVMSPDSGRSEWVEREVAYAQELGKPIFPLLLEGKARAFIRLINIQYEDVTDRALPSSRLVQRLGGVVEGGQVTVTADPVAPPPGDRLLPYLNAIEYIDFDAFSGEGRFAIRAYNRYHANKGPGAHIDGTPTDDEWRDELFLSATRRIREESAILLALLTGWASTSLTATRPKSHGRFGVEQRFDSAQPIAIADWQSVDALLHLRRWETFRSVDAGFVDFYVDASSADPFGGYVEAKFDEAVRDKLVRLRDAILTPITAIVRSVLDDPSLALVYSGTVEWERENTPFSGASSYRYRLVVVDGGR